MKVLNAKDELTLITARFNESQQMAKIGSWDWQIETNKVWWSDQTYKIFGIKKGSIKVKYETFFDMVHPDEKEVVTKTMDAALSNKKPYDLNSTVLLKDGTIKVVHIQGKVVFYGEKAVRMHGTAQDITRRHAIEQEIVKSRDSLEEKVKERTAELMTSKEIAFSTLEKLKQTQDQLLLSEKMASIGQLTAGIAHELNNPINFINASSSALGKDIEDLKELLILYQSHLKEMNGARKEIEKFQQEIDIDFLNQNVSQSIEDIKTGVKRAAEIVKGLKIFSHPEESNFVFCDIHTCIRNVIAILNTRIKGKIHLGTDFDFRIPELLCMPNQVDQVLLNVLNNAIDAVQDKGIITIRTKKDADWAYIIISDNGMGIEPALIGKIFEPFFTTKEVGQGTGLGLSISHSIIKKHHGKIIVTSEEGKGSIFTIMLPLK